MLKNKNKKTKQIGGKGTSRIIIKRKRNKPTINKNNYRFKQKIDSINKKILALDIHNYLKLREFLDGLITGFLKDIKRTDINKKNGLKYSTLNLEGNAFIYKNFFYPVNEQKILLKSDCFKFAEENFKINGKNTFINFLDGIDNILVKKEYNIDLNNEKYNQNEFKRALSYFKISDKNKIHFKDIREQYELKIHLENLTDKEKQKINTYYLILRNQYDEYLKSL